MDTPIRIDNICYCCSAVITGGASREIRATNLDTRLRIIDGQDGFWA